MYGGWTEYAVLWTNFRVHLRHIKRFHDVQLLSFSAKSTFKIINLGGYVFRIVLFKLLNNDDKKCNENSIVN